MVAAARVKPEIGPDTARLKVNRLLNMSGTRGRGVGNALGVLGLLFAGIESGLGYFNDGIVPDSAATVAAGMLTLAAVFTVLTGQPGVLRCLLTSSQMLIAYDLCRLWNWSPVQICTWRSCCCCCWSCWRCSCFWPCGGTSDCVLQFVNLQH